MFNVQGKAFITNLKEITPKLITGTVYTFRKEGEEFKTTFVKCKIVGNAITNLILNNICEKDKIMIKSAVLQSNSFINKEGKEVSSLEMTIFDLDKYEEDSFLDMPVFGLDKYKEEPQRQDLKQNRFKRK